MREAGAFAIRAILIQLCSNCTLLLLIELGLQQSHQGVMNPDWDCTYAHKHVSPAEAAAKSVICLTSFINIHRSTYQFWIMQLSVFCTLEQRCTKLTNLRACLISLCNHHVHELTASDLARSSCYNSTSFLRKVTDNSDTKPQIGLQ